MTKFFKIENELINVNLIIKVIETSSVNPQSCTMHYYAATGLTNQQMVMSKEIAITLPNFENRLNELFASELAVLPLIISN